MMGNFQCYARGLHETCVMVTLNDRRIFDFERFLDHVDVAELQAGPVRTNPCINFLKSVNKRHQAAA